jgi:hypothetical protein
MKTILREASFFLGGFVFALLLLITVNVVRNWKAITVAMQNPEIVSSLKVAEPTFEIKNK